MESMVTAMATPATKTPLPLIDLHTHILPGIDDGARDERESIAMLEMLERQRVDTVVLTPHYPSAGMLPEEFLQKRQEAFDRIRFQEVAGRLRLELASETFFSKALLQMEDIKPLCIGGKYLLIELAYATEFSPFVCDQILKIQYVHGVRPILAHVERYEHLMRHPKVLDSLVDEGLLTQINVSSLDSYWLRRKLFKMLERGHVHFLGTDCHRINARKPDYRRYADQLAQALGEDMLSQLMQNARDVIGE
jgi:protein-tyrosine phosphatase